MFRFATCTIAVLVSVLGGTVSININFQPRTLALEPGYVMDYGSVYGDRGNGYTYGWDDDHTIATGHDNTRYRRECLDTDLTVIECSMIVLDRFLTLDDTSRWSIKLPPADYRVSMLFSDAQNPTQTLGCQLQGESASLGLVTRATPTNYTKTVSVLADGAYANKIEFEGSWLGTSAGSCASVAAIYIDTIGSWAPTHAPSLSPSQWFQNPGHPENITIMQGHIVNIFSKVEEITTMVNDNKAVAAEATLDLADLVQQNLIDQVTWLKGMIVDLQGNVTSLKTQLASEVSTRQQLSSDFSTTRNAILQAVAQVPNVVRSSPLTQYATPEVSSSGSDLTLSSQGGSLTMETNECRAFDPCDIIGALQLLKQA